MLRVARAGAVKARTQGGNQLRGLIVTAHQQVRRRLGRLPRLRQVEAAAWFHPRGPGHPRRGCQLGEDERVELARLQRENAELAMEKN